MNSSNKKEICWIVFLYSIAHGLILFLNGVYWDDWLVYKMDPAAMIERFRQAGSIGAYIHIFMLSFPNEVFLYRAVTFLCYLGMPIILNEILKQIKGLKNSSRLFIVLFFALFPVNNARVPLIDFPYTIRLFCFFLGFWMVSKYMNIRSAFLRIASLSFFLFSFFTNSLLVFYLLPILFMIYQEKPEVTLKSMLLYVGGRIDFFILPIVFWIIKKIYFVPYGLYATYNSIETKNITAQQFIKSINSSFFAVLDIAIRNISLIIILVTIMLSYLYLRFPPLEEDATKKEKNHLWVLFGAFCFLIAIFPYLVVGKTPLILNWYSRHQLLVPLGASLMLYFGLQMFQTLMKVQEAGIYALYGKKLHFSKYSSKIRIFILFLFISAFIKMNMLNYIDDQREWYKQVSLMENLRSSDIIRNHTTFLFKDNCPELNAHRGSRITFYEYTGLLKQAFNNEKRYAGYWEGDKDYPVPSSPTLTSLFNMGEYKPIKPEYAVFVNKGALTLTRKEVVKLKYYELFEPQKFQERIMSFVSLQYKRI